MRQSVSAGAVIFRRVPHGGVKFLVLFTRSGYWYFPKGKLEEGEKPTAAFFREVEEETGLKQGDLHVVPNFRAASKYTFFVRHRERAGRKRRMIQKTDLFYLAESNRWRIVISPEHEGFAWFTREEALRHVKHENSRRILQKAYEAIQSNLRRHSAHP